MTKQNEFIAKLKQELPNVIGDKKQGIDYFFSLKKIYYSYNKPLILYVFIILMC